jgi:hypothetical protein
MMLKLLAAVAAGLLCAIAPARASDAAALAEIHRLDTLLQQTTPAAARFEDARVQEQVARAIERLRTRADPVVRRKLARLQALHQERARQLASGRMRHKAAPAPNTSVQRLFGPESVGSRCESAIALGDGVRGTLPAGSSVWIRIDTQPGQAVRLSTHGSAIDTQVSAFADCRTLEAGALAHNDDSRGLQSDLTLVPRSQTFWFVRVDNPGDAGPLVVSGGPVATLGGRVLHEGTSQPIRNVRVTTFLDSGSGDYYPRDSAVTDAQGTFAIGVDEPGLYFVRTGIEDGIEPPPAVVHEGWPNAPCMGPE